MSKNIKLFYNCFKINENVLLIETDNIDILNRIKKWLEPFMLERACDAYKKYIRVTIYTSDEDESLSFGIPQTAESVFSGYTAHYFNKDNMWYIEYPDIGIVKIDKEHELITASAKWQTLLSKSWYLQDFFHPVFELLRERGTYLYHSGAVCMNNDGLIISGRSGKGKTTLTVDLLEKGFSFMSDDRCFLEKNNNDIELTGFYEDIRVFPNNVKHIEKFKNLESFNDEKIAIDIRKYYEKNSFRNKCLLKGMIFPFWNPKGYSRLEPLSVKEKMVELLPLTLECFDQKTARLHFEFNAYLAREYPGVRLYLGKDRNEWHKLVLSLLKGW